MFGINFSSKQTRVVRTNLWLMNMKCILYVPRYAHYFGVYKKRTKLVILPLVGQFYTVYNSVADII